MSGVRHIKVIEDEDGMRLDRWIRAHFPTIPHGAVAKLLRKGLLRIDGTRARPDTRVQMGQMLRIPPELNETPPQTKPQMPHELVKILRDNILHRDDDVLVINKPAGIAVQGGSQITQHIDAALAGLQFDAAAPPLLVHRLDKGTSGVLVLARHRKAAQFLTHSFAERRAHKTYLAIVHGCPEPPIGRIATAVANRSASSDYRTHSHNDDFSLLILTPSTGRKHQLRAHMTQIGHPILGDDKYAAPESHVIYKTKKLHLHAAAITMPHPRIGSLDVGAPLPLHMKQTLTALELIPSDRLDTLLCDL